MRYTMVRTGCFVVRGTYCGVGDFSILHGDIEVDPDEHTLVLEDEVSDRELVCERHGFEQRRISVGWFLSYPIR